jgi:DNA end-binding protein Ku
MRRKLPLLTLSIPMAPRPYWKGYLKLSLVTCPVAMAPAISESAKVRFHTLNRRTGNRVKSRYADAETEKPLGDDDQVLGYERGAGEFVVLEDDELESVALESTHTIDIDAFVPKEKIDWIWYDRPHYLVPDGPVGEEAFSVIREAMATTRTIGISRLVLYRRERAVMLEPRDRGIVLWTLRYSDELRSSDAYFDDIESEKIDPKLLALVTQLIKERTKPWDPSMAEDPVQDQLLDLIEAKRQGKRPRKAAAKPEEHPTNVIDIMDALRKSLAERERRPKKR